MFNKHVHFMWINRLITLKSLKYGIKAQTGKHEPFHQYQKHQSGALTDCWYQSVRHTQQLTIHADRTYYPGTKWQRLCGRQFDSLTVVGVVLLFRGDQKHRNEAEPQPSQLTTTWRCFSKKPPSPLFSCILCRLFPSRSINLDFERQMVSHYYAE